MNESLVCGNESWLTVMVWSSVCGCVKNTLMLSQVWWRELWDCLYQTGHLMSCRPQMWGTMMRSRGWRALSGAEFISAVLMLNSCRESEWERVRERAPPGGDENILNIQLQQAWTPNTKHPVWSSYTEYSFTEWCFMKIVELSEKCYMNVRCTLIQTEHWKYDLILVAG